LKSATFSTGLKSLPVDSDQMDGIELLTNAAIVLLRPRYPENIGSAARALRNMGLGQLIVVDPPNCDLTKVLKLATHEAFDVVEEMECVPTLEEALSPFHYVVGTTARLGGQRQSISTPSVMAAKLAAMLPHNRVALLFGPEDSGLTNADLRLCHELVTIPTAGFASLNLAQAVMVMCYELHMALRQPPQKFNPRLASRHELDGMYAQVKDILVRINYLNPENPDYWMNRVRHFFTRLQLRSREVSIIRGICRQINWYSQHQFQKGQRSRPEKEESS
jgi:tRNA/rRNA methyltransferase